jgi:hypothetical protein
MKMHRAWMRVTAAAATTLATLSGNAAVGQSQYGPYAGAPQYGAAPQYAVAPQYAQYPTTVPPYGVQPVQTVQVPVYPTATLPTTAPVSTYSVAASQPQQYPQYPATPQPAPQPTYIPAQQQPAYVAALPHYANSVAKQQERRRYQPPQYQRPSTASAYATLAQNSSDTVTPGAPTIAPSTAPAVEPLPSPTPAMGGAAGQGSPYPSTLGYMSGDPGYTNCDNNFGYGAIDGYDECCDDGGRWFGGVYGLYMTRTQGPYRNYTAGIDSAATGTPYFPQSSDIENYSDCAFLVPHWRGGAEARLGFTFGVGDSCDYGDCYDDCGGYGNACGCETACQPCCQQMYGLEVAWWGLDNEVQEQYVDGPVVGNFRYYGMVNYAGLEYDDGGGAQDVNDFYNYQIPVTGLGAETVLAQRVRTNFTCQNLELNFLRLPLMTGCCSYDSCDPAFTLTGLCGVRYFRFDDDLEFGTEWSTGANPTFDGWRNGPNELFHDIQMENQLVGFQLGANMNYIVASRWNAFWDTSFGLYNNHITQYQRMYNPLVGPATFIQEGRDATVNSSKNDIAFLGEMRLGGGYLFTANWRGILAYRAIAVSGAALAPDQIKPDYSNWGTAALIDADGSLIVHGIQAGLECNY